MSEQRGDRSVTSTCGDQRQALLDFAISRSSAVYYIADVAGARPLRFIGDNVRTITGHEPEAFLRDVGYGRGLIHPEDRALYLRRMEELAARGSLVHEYRFRCADGRYRWFHDEQRIAPPDQEAAAGPESGPESGPEFIGCMTDITDRVEAEQESRRLARVLRHAIETVPNGFAIYDADETLALCNTAFAGTIGETPEALAGSRLLENARRLLARLKRIDGKVVRDPEAVLPQAMARWRESEHEPIEMELAKGGWLQVTSHPIADGGRVDILTDITRLKSAEFSMRDSEEQFRSIVEANPSPVRVSDFESWEILYESPAAAALFGHPWPARDGRATSVNYADMAERQWVIETLHRDRRLDNHEIVMRRADGSIFWVSLSCRIVRYQGKDVCISSLVDLTETKAREAELTQARETLDDAIESLYEGLALFDADDRLVLCNTRFRELNAPCGDLLVPGRRWVDLLRNRAEVGLFLAAEGRVEDWVAERLAQRGLATDTEMELPGNRWVLISHRPTRQGGMVHSWREITESRRMAQDLREAEERVRSVLEGCPLPVRMWRLESHDVIYESPASRAMFGRDATRLTPEERRIVYVDPADREPYLQRLRETGAVDHQEMQLRRADGSIFWAAVSARLIQYRGEQVVVSAVIDLAERRRREEELRQARETLEDAIESLPEGFALFDSEDRLLLCNAQYREFNALSADKLHPGTTWQEFIRAGAERGQYLDAIGREEAWIAERMKRGSLGRGAARGVEFQQNDGRWYHAFSQETRQGGYVGIRIDITDSKKLELALRESEEMVRRILEASTVPISMVRLSDARILYESPAAMAMYGDQPAEKERFATDSWVDIAERERNYEELCRNGKLENVEALFLRYDGSTFWGSLSGRVIRYQGEEVAVTSVYDLTERRQMELALRENEEMVRRVLEACPVPITMTRADDGAVIYESPAARALLKYERPKERRNATETWTGDREIFVERLRRDRAVDGEEVQYRKADGELFWCAVSSRLIEYRGDEVIVSSLLDLTERLAAEAELTEQRERLHQSEKLSALGELLAGVSHELNNPLSVLVGQALMLKEAAEDERTATRAEKISNAADRCARIVKTFLAMARQEPGRKVPTDLNELIEGALEMTAYGLRTSNVELDVVLAAELPRVSADPDQMRQVFTNLIVNAQHALQEVEGPRRLSIGTATAAGQVVVTVADSGPGIPEGIRGRIFEPLYTTKQVGSGTGIGLALCHRIVEGHGGVIAVEGPRGGGATFILRLPFIVEPGPTAALPPEGQTEPRPYRVLVVDDELEVGQIISEVLEIDGHDVDVVTSGQAALEKLGAARYDVVLSDIRMPGMDGPSFYRQVKAEAPEHLLGLAFITGDTLSPSVRGFLDETGRPFLEKPILPSDVRELVGRLMRRKAGGVARDRG